MLFDKSQKLKCLFLFYCFYSKEKCYRNFLFILTCQIDNSILNGRWWIRRTGGKAPFRRRQLLWLGAHSWSALAIPARRETRGQRIVHGYTHWQYFPPIQHQQTSLIFHSLLAEIWSLYLSKNIHLKLINSFLIYL